jgi:YD repeat-containing protein
MAELTQPINRPVGERTYELVEDWTYEWDHAGLRRRITVPKGFVCDGASVPRLVWTCTGVLPDGLIRAAALVHDWLYKHRGRLPLGSYHELRGGHWLDVPLAASREASDRLFARIMREAGVPRLKRRMAYISVRACGWWTWRSGALRRTG